MLIGSDGVFDKLSNKEVVKAVFRSIEEDKLEKTVHEQSGKAVEEVIKTALREKSVDNVTAILIVFKSFKQLFKEKLLAAKMTESMLIGDIAGFNKLCKPEH